MLRRHCLNADFIHIYRPEWRDAMQSSVSVLDGRRISMGHTDADERPYLVIVISVRGDGGVSSTLRHIHLLFNWRCHFHGIPVPHIWLMSKSIWRRVEEKPNYCVIIVRDICGYVKNHVSKWIS